MPKEKIKQGNSEVVADGWADGVYVGPPEAEQGPSDHGSLGGLADDDSPTYQSSEGDPVMAPYEPNPEPVGAEEDEELRTLICGVDQVCEGCEDCEDYNRELAIEDILLDDDGNYVPHFMVGQNPFDQGEDFDPDGPPSAIYYNAEFVADHLVYLANMNNEQARIEAAKGAPNRGLVDSKNFLSGVYRELALAFRGGYVIPGYKEEASVPAEPTVEEHNQAIAEARAKRDGFMRR